MKKGKLKKYVTICCKALNDNDFIKALKEYKKIPNSYLSTLGLVNKGICYSEIGKYSQAIKCWISNKLLG